jgi:hypothetical protein
MQLQKTILRKTENRPMEDGVHSRASVQMGQVGVAVEESGTVVVAAASARHPQEQDNGRPRTSLLRLLLLLLVLLLVLLVILRFVAATFAIESLGFFAPGKSAGAARDALAAAGGVAAGGTAWSELVVAHYAEDLSFVPRVPADRVTVYTKKKKASAIAGCAPPAATAGVDDAACLCIFSGDTQCQMSTAPDGEIAAAPCTVTRALVALDNVGRESHTWLFHIVARYDSLADYTLFIPGSMLETAGKRERFADITREWAHAHAHNVALRGGAACLDTAAASAVDTARTRRESQEQHHARVGWHGAYAPHAHFIDSMVPRQGWLQRLYYYVKYSSWGSDMANFSIDAYEGTTASNRPADGATDQVTAAPRPLSAWVEQHAEVPFATQHWCGFDHNGMFGVSARAIRAHPRAYYQALLATVAVGRDAEAGHYLERMWRTLFTCSLSADAQRRMEQPQRTRAR